MSPKGVGHLIVTGRITDGDRDSHTAVRNMMCCAVNSQGAGVATAVSIQSGSDFIEVGIQQLQKILVAQGAGIH